MKNPFRKPTEDDKRIAALRAELKAAVRKLADLDAGKAAALTDSIAFAQWSGARTTAALEVDRLTGLIETTETDAEVARKSEADAAARKRVAEARKAADELVERMKTDGKRIAVDLLLLAKEAAQQALDAKKLNENLPDGEAPVPVADILARDAGSLPRQDISSRGVDLWVAETTGDIIGDQDAVSSDDGIHGQVHVMGGTMRWKCRKRSFREINFHPSVSYDWPGSFHALIRLPSLDGPGALFDGARMTAEAVAALDVAAAVEPAKRAGRAVQFELIPADPKWPPTPAPARTEAEAQVTS